MHQVPKRKRREAGAPCGAGRGRRRPHRRALAECVAVDLGNIAKRSLPTAFVTFLIARLPKLPSGLRLGLIAVFLTVSGKDYLVLRGRVHITPTGPGQHRLLNAPRG